MDKLSIIISAKNEGPRIGEVLKPLFGWAADELEIIVVANGCSDETAGVAREYGASVIEIKENVGKAAAMAAGLKKSSGENIMFLDADLVGFKKSHVERMIEILIEEKSDIAIALLSSEEKFTHKLVSLSQKNFNYLSGQQIAKKETWERIFSNIKNVEKLGYGIERKIKESAKELKLKTSFLVWGGVSQVMKEQKEGFKKGIVSRLNMYKEMFRKPV